LRYVANSWFTEQTRDDVALATGFFSQGDFGLYVLRTKGTRLGSGLGKSMVKAFSIKASPIS